MKNITMFLVLSFALLFVSNPALAQRERYKSLNERLDSSSSYGRSYSSNRHDRYQSKPKAERDRFDRNLNRYNNYSPEQKQRAQQKWKSFKQETTPEERKYIMEKMRRNRRN